MGLPERGVRLEPVQTQLTVGQSGPAEPVLEALPVHVPERSFAQAGRD